jgi:exosortase/archaeosortase family protein
MHQRNGLLHTGIWSSGGSLGLLAWKALGCLQAGFSVWLVHSTQEWPSTTLLCVVVWGGAVICFEDQLDHLKLQPTRPSLVAGVILLLYANIRGVATLSIDSVVYAIPLIQGFGLALLARPISRLRIFSGSLLVLALLPLEPILDSKIIPEEALSVLTGRITQVFLLLIGENPLALGRTVQLGDSAVNIGNVCSGIDLIAQLTTIACVFAIAFPLRNKFFALLYVLLTTPFAVVMNAFRIVVLALINSTEWSNKEEIFDFFHSGSGSFVFAAIAAILMGHAYMHLIDRQLEESGRS